LTLQRLKWVPDQIGCTKRASCATLEGAIAPVVPVTVAPGPYGVIARRQPFRRSLKRHAMDADDLLPASHLGDGLDATLNGR